MATLSELLIKLRAQGAAAAAAAVKSVSQQVRETGQAANTSAGGVNNFTKSVQAFSQMSRSFGGGGGGLLGRLMGGASSIGNLQKLLSAAKAPVIGPTASGGNLADGAFSMAAMAGAGLVIAAITAMFEVLKTAIAEASEFTRETQALRSVTGGTAGEAAGLHAAFAAAGVSQGMGIREVEKIEQAARTAKGSRALGQLGVGRGSGDGIQDFTKIIAALSKMQDGVKKTRIEMDLFGARGVASLGPLLRMTEFQTAQIKYLSRAFNGGALTDIERMNTSFNLLGETILQRLVVPFTAKLAPALDDTAKLIMLIVNGLSVLNDWMGGDLLPNLFGPFTQILNEYADFKKALGFGGNEDSNNIKRTADATEEMKKLIGGGKNAQGLKSELDIEFEMGRFAQTGIG